jgi:radical SAM protein with 4Fe4S-binding SPASM domain
VGAAAQPLLHETPLPAGDAAPIPHVVAWNLTRRCNLECAHCYISAGPDVVAAGPGEAAGGELSTAEVKRIAAEILELNPAPMFILSGGEPLLRDDLCDIASFAASRGATVVVGTNGTLLSDERISALKDAGVTGVAVSVDSLESSYHDRFRHGTGALANTTAAIQRLRAHRLDFIIQTTMTRGNRHELAGLAAWSAEAGAVSFNVYFLVPTGRGTRLSDLTALEYETALAELEGLHREYLGRMMVRAKCAPHFMRHVHAAAPASPVLNYETRCPCGVQYCRITPDGKLTPCPYLPEAAGDLRRSRFADLWREAPLFRSLRAGTLGGKCGRCEYRKVCGGCRARAFAVEGDPLAADPSCAYEPSGSAPLIESAAAVRYGQPAERSLRWTPEAEERIRRIPSFVRGVVVRRLEDYARTQGRTEVTADLLAEVRRAMPIDFSRRKPFFLDDA